MRIRGLGRLRALRYRLHGWRAAVAEAALRRKALGRLAMFPAITDRRPSGLPGPLIISLTSYPPRYPTLALTIKSLLDQTVAADRTILWIADGDSLPPDDVTALCDHGLEIRRCRNRKSYNKLFPALAAFQDGFVVTADDDIYYPPDWLEGLAETYDPAAPAIVCHRAHLARFDAEGMPLPYLEWELETARTVVEGPGEAMFPTGVGGVLYPVALLPPTFRMEDEAVSSCPHADDVWFFLCEQQAGLRRVRVPGHHPLVTWDGSQEDGLMHGNVHGGGNDAQLRAGLARIAPLASGQVDRPARALPLDVRP